VSDKKPELIAETVQFLWFDGVLSQKDAELVREAFLALSRLPAGVRQQLARAVANAEHIDGSES
jgi:hypothetical protein